jgi:hypothetical protein
MNDQPEALRLAAVPIFERSITWQSQATMELRRLHATNIKLLGALDMIRETLNGGEVDDLLYIINTAIKKAEGHS